MSATLTAPILPAESKVEIVYPEDDGNPMSDHTLQFRWIVIIKEGLEAVFADADDVFVAGDLLWYPVEGDSKTRIAPDAMVVFGRPKVERGSYQQWIEDNITPQVVFEILSPGNRFGEMREKHRFYERHGVEEYYRYNPFTYEFLGWVRPYPDSPLLEPIDFTGSFISPRLGVRFVSAGEGRELQIFGPNGKRFLTFVELSQARDAAEEAAGNERRRAISEEQRANAAEQKASAETERAERLAAQLRALGIEPQP